MQIQPEVPEATIDQKVVIFEEAGNGPEATAEYRASLEATAAQEAEEAQISTTDVEARNRFGAVAQLLRTESGTETKFGAIADIFEMMSADW